MKIIPHIFLLCLLYNSVNVCMEKLSISNQKNIANLCQEAEDVVKNYKLLSKKGQFSDSIKEKLLNVISSIDNIKETINISEDAIALQVYHNHLSKTNLEFFDPETNYLQTFIFFVEIKTYNDVLHEKKYRTPTLQEYNYHLLNKQNKVNYDNAIQKLQKYKICVSSDTDKATYPEQFDIPKNAGTEELEFLITCIQNMCENKKGVLKEMVKIIFQKITSEPQR